MICQHAKKITRLWNYLIVDLIHFNPRNLLVIYMKQVNVDLSKSVTQPFDVVCLVPVYGRLTIVSKLTRCSPQKSNGLKYFHPTKKLLSCLFNLGILIE